MKTQPPNGLALTASQINAAALLLKILDHFLRLAILQFIHQSKQVTVTAIHRKFRIEQSVASDHLGLLRDAGLVLTERSGRFIFYTVNYAEVERWNRLVALLQTNT